MKSLKIIISTAIILSLFIFSISLFSSSSSVKQSNAEVITELSVELADLKAELNEIKGSENTSPVGMDPYIGEVILFAGNFAPRGWAFCEGQLLSISQYSALFSILGTTYGGDGRTTFALPDLRGRSPIGAGTGPGLEQIRLGSKGGAFQHALSVSQLPTHKHSFELPTIPLEPDQLKKRMYKPGFNSLLTVENKSKNGTQASVSNTGGNQSFSIRNLYLGMHYIIALQGIYPSRS